MNNFEQGLKTLAVSIILMGSLYLGIIDKDFRATWKEISLITLGGLLGVMVPGVPKE